MFDTELCEILEVEKNPPNPTAAMIVKGRQLTVTQSFLLNRADRQRSRPFRSNNGRSSKSENNSKSENSNRSENNSNNTDVNSNSVPFRDNRFLSRQRRLPYPKSPKSRFDRGNRPGTITRTSTSQRRK